MTTESVDDVQRWTAKRRVDLVVSLLTGATSTAEAARNHGLTIATIEAWREAFLLGAENALRPRPRDDEALKDAEIQRLQRKVGELVMDKDILTAAMKLKHLPFGKGTSEPS